MCSTQSPLLPFITTPSNLTMNLTYLHNSYTNPVNPSCSSIPPLRLLSLTHNNLWLLKIQFNLWVTNHLALLILLTWDLLLELIILPMVRTKLCITKKWQKTIVRNSSPSKRNTQL